MYGYGNPWTDEAIAQLRRLKGEGASSSAIGLELGISRNAVIGKAARLGIGGGAPRGSREAKHYAPRAAPVFQVNFGQLRARKAAKQREPVKPAPPPWEFLGIALLDLTHKHCRYPMGEGAAVLFCGQPIERGSYCGHCYRIVYTPHKPAKRSPFIPTRGVAA